MPQVGPQRHASSMPGEQTGTEADKTGCTPNQAEDLGAVRSDIVAALRRREDLREILRGTEARIGAAESELARIESQARSTAPGSRYW